MYNDLHVLHRTIILALGMMQQVVMEIKDIRA